MNVYIVIVTYKGKLWYEQCFNSLRESIIPLNVVVVDNASNDGTVEYVAESFPEIHLIQSNINLGFGQANNQGIRFALDNGADYVFLLNQDAWIEPDSISKLIEIHKKYPEYGILSPVHLNSSKTAIEYGLQHYLCDYRVTDMQFLNDCYFQDLKEVYNTKYVNAAAWLLPRKIIEIVGGFDPIFFHYGEDDNYMQRVYYHEMKIGICPLIHIVHDTERRKIQKKFLKENHLKVLLANITDINTPFNINAYLREQFLKIFRRLIRADQNQASQLWKELLFIYKLRKDIKHSREQNIKKEKSWLS